MTTFPTMTHWPWFTSQGVELGGVARDVWYWRCPNCRHGHGPFPDASQAKQAGMRHRGSQ